MKFQFGSFSLDTGQFELHGPAGAIDLEPQVFALLAFLMENADRVVSKDEIIDSVWEGRIVSDANLNSRVNAARRAVGDDGKAQAVIKTFPRRGFRFVAELANSDRSSETRAAKPERSLVVVMPFRNLSRDPDKDQFCAGLTEDIQAVLSRLTQFTTVPLVQSISFDENNLDIQSLGRDFGVRYVIGGSLRSAGNSIRVSVQLSDVDTGGVIWTQQFDREFDNIFTVQDEITKRAMGAINPVLSKVERLKAMSKPEHALSAWDYFHRGGKYLFESGRTAEAVNCRLALSELYRAIELDPKSSEVHQYIGVAMFQLGSFCFSVDRKTQLDEGTIFAQRAVSLDRFSVEALSSLGILQLHNKKTADAFRSLEEAHRLDPTNVRTLIYFGMALLCSGDTQGGEKRLRDAIELGRFEYLQGASFVWLAMALILQGRYAEAEPIARQANAHPRTQLWAPVSLILSLHYQGRTDEAAEYLGELQRNFSGVCCVGAADKIPIVDEKHKSIIIDGLRAVGLPEN
jgi:TolB-like protein/Flp pilus assembly protein TadD